MTLVVFLMIIGIALVCLIVVGVGRIPEFRKRWQGAFRYTVALLLAWICLAVLIGISVMIDLFERDLFSFPMFLEALQIPMLLFVGGLMVILISLYGAIGLASKKVEQP
ncbi:hypothetical protein [Chryseolinea sp. H1M3-3]|uniref:hypothetical protein n=1 Tax=Chryseolinea sp. H1M3-3 TaxID=3034144 RepID=UPI0023EC4DEB|nr:hypothetical protein [Chryseolinea sp. H1M3-3]